MGDATTLATLAALFALAFVWYWGAIPAGVALGIDPLIAALVAWLGYSAGVALVVALGGPGRDWLLARLGNRAADPNSLLTRAWRRFGLLGLALLAPITVGAQVGAALGLLLGASPPRLILGMAFGGAVWGAGITLAAWLGRTAVVGSVGPG